MCLIHDDGSPKLDKYRFLPGIIGASEHYYASKDIIEFPIDDILEIQYYYYDTKQYMLYKYSIMNFIWAGMHRYFKINEFLAEEKIQMAEVGVNNVTPVWMVYNEKRYPFQLLEMSVNHESYF